jgi:hypothetical protein
MFYQVESLIMQGRIQDLKLGGRTLKNCAERREAQNILGYFVRKKSRFYAKKSYFFLGETDQKCSPKTLIGTDDAQETDASLLDVHTAKISIKIFQY